MAAITTLAGITKAIAGGLTKKKIMQGAGKALKDTAKGAVKKRLGRKKKKGGPGSPDDEGGDIIQSPSGAIVPTSPLMGDIIVPYPEQPGDERPKNVGVVDFKTITAQLESIVALTSTLEKVSGQSVITKKKIKETNRKNKAKAANRAKEQKQESGGVLGFLGGKAGEVAEASGILNFLGNILTGFVVVNLLPLIPGITSAIQTIGGNLHYFYLGFRGLGQTFKAGKKAFTKAMPPIINDLKNASKPITQAFGRAGQKIKNLFAGLGKIVPKFITKGISSVADGARAVAEGAKNLGRAVTGNTRGAQLGKSAKNLKNLTQTGKSASQATTGALKLRRLHGDEAARMYKGLVDNGMSNAKASKYVMNQIKAGKLTSAPLKGTLGGGIRGSKIFRGGPIRAGKRAVIRYLGKGPVVKKALRNIPVIGPIIVGITSLLSGEPAAQALFKVGGTIVGGILGAFLPIPILGPIIGEIVGEYVGDLMYVLLMGGGPGAVMERMKQDIISVMSAGKMALDWVGRGFGRFMMGIPKLEMPWYVRWMFPDNMKSIPNPLWLLNPINIMDKMSLFWKAFFTDDPVSMGNVEKKKQKQKQNTSGGASQPPKRSSFRKGPSGTAQYNKALQNYNQSQQPQTQQPQTVQPQTPVVPTSGQNTSSGEAMATGLRTGASQYIGGSSDYHIDTQFMKTVPMEQKVAMVDQMAAGYAKQGRVMEFSNQGVAGETWDTNMSYDEKVKLLERAFAAHSHSRYSDRNSIDYYIPKKGDTRFDKSAEGAEILVPTIGASSATYASGGNYGNFIEIKDEKGNVISRTGHGDTRFGPKSGTVQITPGSIKSTPTYTVSGITYDANTGLPISGHEKEEEPQITPARPPASTPQSVERQASYDQGESTPMAPVILPATQQPQVTSAGGGSRIVPIGSGNVLNSYYKSQLVGFLYKQG